MNLTGLGASLGSMRSQYDFKNMTNQELFDTAQDLGQQGKLSKFDADQLSFIAQGVDYSPISGASRSVAQTMSDPAQHDFLSQIQNVDLAKAPGTVGDEILDRLLKVLQTLQDPDGDPPRAGSLQT